MGNITPPTTPAPPATGGGGGPGGPPGNTGGGGGGGGPSSSTCTDPCLSQIINLLTPRILNSQIFVLSCTSGTNYQGVYDGSKAGVGIRYVTKAIFQNLSGDSATVVTNGKQATNYIGVLLNPQPSSNQAGNSVPFGNGHDFIDLQNFFWTATNTSDQIAVYCEW
jgi:hypothetical protein